MLAAKEGCLDVFDLMMQYVDADEACTEGKLFSDKVSDWLSDTVSDRFSNRYSDRFSDK
jgi:benzoyl-CoA reductase/2-hydroxyglutaryl-CoA dehydratase subunit BcrC/BadD/HgdB